MIKLGMLKFTSFWSSVADGLVVFSEEIFSDGSLEIGSGISAEDISLV